MPSPPRARRPRDGGATLGVVQFIHMPEERLQKIIAAAGITSRRKAEELITSGLVSVNGQTITQLGAKADAQRDHIRVNGKLLREPERHVYLLVNKPRGYVTSVTDPEKRPTIMDLIHGVGARVYPVGRLDYASEGLVLLTNDGDLAQKLMHASSHVPKTYLVKVAGKPSAEAIAKLRAGVTILLDGKHGRKRHVRTAPARLQLSRDAPNPVVRAHAHRGPQPANPPHVRARRTSRREDQARALWQPGTGR